MTLMLQIVCRIYPSYYKVPTNQVFCEVFQYFLQKKRITGLFGNRYCQFPNLHSHIPVPFYVRSCNQSRTKELTEGFLRSTILRPWSDTSRMQEWGLCFETPELPTIFLTAWHRTAFPLWHRVSTDPRYPSRYLSRFTFGALGSKSLYSISTAYADGKMPCRPDRRFTPVENQHNSSRLTHSTV